LEFVFRPVYVNGETVLDGTTFTMGNPQGDEFRAPPTRVVVGGAFAGEKGKGEWVYYIGKYEVTEAQYDLIMGSASPRSSSLPIMDITYYEAMDFCRRLNDWLYANALPQLPSSGPFPAFARLPLESEWEFAARGGLAVTPLEFEASMPYPDEDLAPYEWFSGPSSSHNKIQEIGKLQPNQLGIHDMLGNVQEMIQTSYQVEYYQGRSGGFTTRGGHYLTAEDSMNVSLRSEEPYYLGSQAKGMRPNKKVTLGIRLVLSAPLLTDRDAIAAFSSAWANHRKGGGAASPAALSVAPVSDQESVSARDALTRLEALRAELQKSKSGGTALQELAYIESALRDMSKVRAKADADSAKVWVKIASERGLFLSNNLERLVLTQEELRGDITEGSSMHKRLAERLEQYSYNVESGLEDYRQIMTELVKLPESVVEKAFSDHVGFLQQKLTQAGTINDPTVKGNQIRDLTRQMGKLEITTGHWAKFNREKRSDATGWRKDYSGSASGK
jgi:formylglycine-generating enzyme required for sulfatase activity